jgi:hypothetical protein
VVLTDTGLVVPDLSTLFEKWTGSAPRKVDHLTRDWLGDQGAGVG